MRGLVGDRLLKRFFGSVVRRSGFDPPQASDAESGDGEEAAQGKRESEEPEALNAVTHLSDPKD